MRECKTIWLLPDWFFKRQILVSTLIFLVAPITLLMTHPRAPDFSVIEYIQVILSLTIISMLYPYSRYAVQKIIDVWYGNERIYHDGSMHATLGRKYEKMIVGLILLPVLGPACLALLLLARWREKNNCA